MMTEIRAVAICTAMVLADRPEAWNKEQAAKATAFLDKLLADGKIDMPTYKLVFMRLNSNLSARSQLLQKMDFLTPKVTVNAESQEIQKVLDALAAKTKLEDIE